MREVADGVFEIRILFVHAHLVVVDDGVVLVDTGLPGRSARIERALHEARKPIGDVRTILLTHWHADHTGNAADLRRRSGARTVAHAIDAAGITGAGPPADPPPRRRRAPGAQRDHRLVHPGRGAAPAQRAAAAVGAVDRDTPAG